MSLRVKLVDVTHLGEGRMAKGRENTLLNRQEKLTDPSPGNVTIRVGGELKYELTSLHP